ncbi:hypothetical protein DMI70_12010 [Escherichia coli]|nr:hypothetical protein [Escherichia coli]
MGWSHVFFFMGGLGIVISFIWLESHPRAKSTSGVNQRAGVHRRGWRAGSIWISKTPKQSAVQREVGQIKQLLGSRMMIGVYIGQYCINA